MKTRSEAREAVIKILYQLSIFKKANVSYDIDEVIKEVCPISNEFVNSLVYGILEKETSLDEVLNHYLIDWKMERLNPVDQAIFRLGVYELQYTTTPSVVTINEAIELAKKYSDEKVVKMLNGVMDQIYHNEEEKE